MTLSLGHSRVKFSPPCGGSGFSGERSAQAASEFNTTLHSVRAYLASASLRSDLGA